MSATRRILIVEDSSDDATLAQRELTKTVGQCAVQVVDTRDALQSALTDFQPDLIVADLAIPGFDGLAALTIVTELAPLVPVIMWTGSRNESTAVACMRAGASDYVLKDNFQRLGAAVAQGLRERQLRVERHQALEQLRRNEERFRALIANSADLILVLDAAGVIGFASQAAQALLGVPPEAILHQRLMDWVHPQDQPSLTAVLFATPPTPGGAPASLSLRLRHQNGSWRQMESLGSNQLADPAVRGLVLHLRDVTEHTEAREALQRSERLFHTLARTAPIGIFRADASGGLTYTNEQWCAIMGLAPEEALGNGWLQAIHPGDRALVASIWARAVRTGGDFHAEYRYSLPNRAGWVLGQARAERDAEGAIVGQVGTVTDITERKQAEDRLRQSEQRYHRMFERAPVMYVITEAHEGAPVIRDCNQLFLETLGYAPDDVIGQPLASFYSAESRHRLEQGYPLALNDQMSLDERELIARDGRIITTLLRAIPESDVEGRVKGTRAAFVDISRLKEAIAERERAEADLRRSEERYRDLVENIQDLLFTHDLNGQVLYANRALTTILGYPPKGLIGREVRSFLAPVSQANFPNYLTQLQQTGHASGQMQVLTQSGEVRVWEYHNTLRLQDAASPIVRGYARDITEQLRAEAERRLSNERFAELANNVSDVFWVAAPDTWRPLYVNPAFERVFGLDQQAMTQLPQGLLDLALPEDRHSLEEARTLVSRGARAEVQYRVRRPDGAIRWLRVKATPILDDAGAVIRVVGITRDLTEQVEADLRLQESEARFRQLVDHIEEAFWIYDRAEARVAYVSPAYESMFGDGSANFYANPTLYQRYILKEDLSKLNAVLALQAKGERTEVEYRILHPDNGLRWIWDRSFPVGDAHGHLIGTTGIATDITDLKTIREELLELNRSLERRIRERTAEVSDLYENAPAGYHSLNAQGMYVMINQTELAWLGYTREQLVGRMTMHQLLTPNSQRVFAERFPQLLEGGALTDVELEYIRQDGSHLPVAVNATGIFDAAGHFVMSRATVFDLTERKQAELALRQNQMSLQNFLDTASDLIQRIDAAGRYVYVNRAWCDALGYTAEEATHLTMFDTLDPVHHAHCQDILTQLATTGQAQELEVAFITKGGGTLLVEGRVSSHTEANGRTLTNGIFRNITARKRAEDALRQSRDDLRAANVALETAVRMKDEFLSNMSHELRTPLNGILSLTEALEEGVYGSLSTDQNGILRLVIESGQHLLALINDILDLSKIEAGKLELNLTPLNVEEICQASLRLVLQSALQKHLRVETMYASLAAEMVADSRRLKQMLVNLLSNAIKFTPEGGQIGLEVSDLPDGSGVRFLVWDTGIGIAPQALPLLFQPFVQVDSALNRQFSGTGLGLSLVRKLAELHGGSIGVESELNKGSRFHIDLPAKLQEADAGRRPALSTGHTGPLGGAAWSFPGLERPADGAPGPLILLAEDNPVNQRTFCDYLLAKGFRVSLAANGQEALARAAEDPPDLILMDIQMPKMDGFQAMRHLRAQPELAQIPIIALTALAMAGDRERCLAAGANDYLTKPVSLKTLTAKIARLLRLG